MVSAARQWHPPGRTTPLFEHVVDGDGVTVGTADGVAGFVAGDERVTVTPVLNVALKLIAGTAGWR